MQLESCLGTVTVAEEDVITFPQGILGFEEYKHYTVLEQPDSVFRFLQCIDEPQLAFVVMFPELVDADYSVTLTKEQRALLEIDQPEDGVVYGIVTVPEQVAEMTINLQAPVVINKRKNIGAQVVLVDGKYHTRHNVLAGMQASAYYTQKANA